MNKRIAFLATLALSIVASAHVNAQVDEGAQQKLVGEGVQLFEQRKYSEACEKLAAANRIRKDAPIVNLEAGCYERLGRLATAWTTFVETKSLAEKAQDSELAASAAGNVARLEPKLARITFGVGGGAPPRGLSVSLDGQPLPRERMVAAIPVDSGRHEIRFESAGRAPVVTTFAISDGESRSIDVPSETAPEQRESSAADSAETPARSAPAPAPVKRDTPAPPLDMPPSSGERKPSSLRYVGMAGVAAGAVTLGVGLYLGLSARSTWDDAKRMDCRDDGMCPTQSGADLVDHAASKANLSTIAVGAGLGLAVTGALLWVFAPSVVTPGPRDASRASVSVNFSGTGVAVVSRF